MKRKGESYLGGHSLEGSQSWKAPRSYPTQPDGAAAARCDAAFAALRRAAGGKLKRKGAEKLLARHKWQKIQQKRRQQAAKLAMWRAWGEREPGEL
jgi:hypothetical protein